MPPYDYEQLRTQLNDPENWKTASIPRKSPFGAIDPAIHGLRSLYQSVINRVPETVAERGMQSQFGRRAVSQLVEEGPGIALKTLRGELQRMNQRAHNMGPELTKWGRITIWNRLRE
jgi:hypothetical protein